MATIHGMTETPTWNSWKSMLERVLKKHHKNHDYYKQFDICQEWKDSFVSFYDDMGDRRDGKTLDRIDNNLGDNTDNCRWATPKEQANNRGDNVFLEFKGKSMTISQWSDDIGVSTTTISKRIGARMPIERVLFAGRLGRVTL